MNKICLFSAMLMLASGTLKLHADCFSDRSSMQHFHHFDGTQFSLKFLKHWYPKDKKEYQGTYRSSGGGGGVIVVAHLADFANPKSKTVFSGSIVEQDGSDSIPNIHSFQNLEIEGGKIADAKFSGKFYRFPHYENQTEYFFILVNDRIYVRTKTKKREVTIDEL